MGSPKKIWLYALAALIVLALPQFARMYTDYLWFEAQGFSSVFFTTLAYQAVFFVAPAISIFIALFLTVVWTERRLKKHKYKRSPYILPAISFAAIFFGAGFTTQWDVALRYLNQYAFSVQDPVFGQDIGFFVYTLPFFELLVTFAILLVALSALCALIVYALTFRKKVVIQEQDTIIHETTAFDFGHYLEQVKKYGYTQLLVLGAAFLVLTGIRYYLSRFDLLFSMRGAVYGVGFTEQFVRLPTLWVLSILCMLGAIALLVNIRLKKDVVVTGVVIALLGVSALGAGAAFGVQALIVEPDEINKEREFIVNEIAFTRQAYGLDRVVRQELDVGETLTEEMLDRHRPTLDNARLWDDRPLLQTLNEIQIFRTYYIFPGIDVGRYMINGERRLMMLAAREVDISRLEPQIQTWVNRHLVYTHGFGAVMAPASDITSANLPRLVIQDIPPRSSVDIEITQPRIYYGENTRNYVIVNTLTAELDFPQGDENVRIHYPGDGGVLLDSAFTQAMYALHFRAPQIFFSNSITPESRIQYHRHIRERVEKLAPFLITDNDPYLVIRENGELYWIVDGYTTTSRFPYSRPVRFHGHTTNYVRNSVKATINAFDGTVTMYIAEPQDPLIRTYQQAFPDLFRPLSEMPDDLYAHIRYPQDLFSVQADRYRDYHMQDPETFYNREDAWRIPNEIVRGVEQSLRPYYQIMQLPGFEEAEFIQVQPFIPRGRENLIGWMAARSDGENYGELRAYHFSRQELTFGPMQIESRIDQDTEISQQITLWSRAGSGVVRGNLLVIPIENTILYVEPLFLEAREQGSLPQLMRVIAVHQDRIAMAPTLDQALAAIIDPTVVTPIVDDVITDIDRIVQIREAYYAAMDALTQGDFVLYAERIVALEELLE